MKTRRLGVLAALAIVPALAIAGDDPKTKSTFVDLQPNANHKLDDDLTGFEENNLKEVPRGEKDLEGTKFKIGEKLIRVKGNAEDDTLPEKVEGIKVDAKADRVVFLHGTEYRLEYDPDNETDEADREIGA